MNHHSSIELFSSYCYGPADIVAVWRRSRQLQLTLLDSAGRTACATYNGCVYWQLTGRHAGAHLSLVQQFSARQLLLLHSSPALKAMQEFTGNIAQQLERWEKQGCSFYLHMGSFPEEQLLVAAQSLDYEESD